MNILLAFVVQKTRPKYVKYEQKLNHYSFGVVVKYCFSKIKTARGDGLMVKDDPESLRPKFRPSIWSLYRPIDITMYDLMYEDDWRQGQKI